MGDMGDMWKESRTARRELRERLGVNCPRCNIKQPKRVPSVLLPGQKCKVCHYRDPRKRED